LTGHTLPPHIFKISSDALSPAGVLLVGPNMLSLDFTDDVWQMNKRLQKILESWGFVPYIGIVTILMNDYPKSMRYFFCWVYSCWSIMSEKVPLLFLGRCILFVTECLE
jgi:hypothetical protein